MGHSIEVILCYSHSGVAKALCLRCQTYATSRVYHKKHSALCPTFGHYPALTYMYQDAPFGQSSTDTLTVHVRQFPLRTTVPLIFASDPLHYVRTIVQIGKTLTILARFLLPQITMLGDTYPRHSFVSNICFNWARIFSTGPLLYCRYGIVVNCWSDNNPLTSFMNSVVTLPSCSISISLSISTLLNVHIKASATRSVSMLGNATASGYLVAQSVIVKMYRDFLSEWGLIGPTNCTDPSLNGVSINGNFPKGTLVTQPFWIVLWQMSQGLQNLDTSAQTPGPKKKKTKTKKNKKKKQTQIQLCPIFCWCLNAQSTKFRMLISEQLSHENPQGPQVAN